MPKDVWKHAEGPSSGGLPAGEIKPALLEEPGRGKRLKAPWMGQMMAITAFLLLLIVAFSVLSPVFLTVKNTINVLRQTTVIALISFGMTFVILNKGIDLSVGSTVAAAGIVAAVFEHSTHSLALTILSGLMAGVIVGLVNGLIIELANIPDFIVTLATMSILRGIVMVYTEADPIYYFEEGFYFVGQGYVGPIPTPVVITVVLFAVAYVVLRFTQFGRFIYAVGGNREVARLAGIHVKKVRILVYAICGFLAASSGVLLTSRAAAAVPTAGQGYELDAIAAVVLGGTSLFGGRGSIAGTIIGLLIMGVLANGLVLLNMNPFWILIVRGVILLIAISTSSLRQPRTA